MNRNTFLKVAGLGVAGGAVGLAFTKDKWTNYTRKDYNASKAGWTNWSGLQRCNPVGGVATPADEQQLVDIMKNAKGVRFVGSGHSFMPLVPTPQTIISLDQFNGIISTDDSKLQARVKAGSKLAYLSRELDKKGQAFMNLPDINTQSIAGAIGTATHGTGRDFKALHAYVTGLKLVTPKGEVFECNESKNADLFQAAKVSIGSLGAITEVTLQNTKSFALHRVVSLEPLNEVLEKAPEMIQRFEHFEMMYIPHTNICMVITHERHNGALKPREKSEDEDALKTLKQLRDYTSWFPKLRQLVAEATNPTAVIEDFSDDSWRLLAQPRVTKFNESEYHVPFENGLACFEKVCRKMETIKESYFPIEFRCIKGDDAWISPFHQRDSCSVAIHADAEEEYKYLISTFGPIFRSFQGRPHWGKLNDFSKAEFQNAYPKWKDFIEVRNTCDPEGKLLNDYLRKIFI